MKNFILNIIQLSIVFLFIGVAAICSQTDNLCDCSEKDECKSSSKSLNFDKYTNLSDSETLKIMECLLNQKGNKTPFWGVTLNNRVSQTFGPSPLEVVALFRISVLFSQNKDFANAIVLVYDDEKLNTSKAIKIAYKSYRKWFKKVKEIGLEEARKQKLDPLSGSRVSWY
jgi:hypothetical protein